MDPSRRSFAVALAILACGVVPGGALAREPADLVGVTSEDVFAGSPSYRRANLRAQRAAGVRLLRQTFDWSTIETSRGRYELARYDDYVATAASHHIRVLPVLFRAPSFHATPVREYGGTTPPSSNRAFARFAAVLVRRYGPRGSLWRERPDVPERPIRSWQIWNEPNLRAYWKPRPSAVAYVRLLRAGYFAIKREDRRAEVVTAGLTTTGRRGAVPLTRYLTAMYRAGARRYFDTLGYNAYGPDAKYLAHGLRTLRRLMNRNRDRRAAIWITELGWATRGPRNRFNVGEHGQARRITRSFRVIASLRRRCRVRGVVYYSGRDRRPYPPIFRNGWGLYTGLATLSGARKPGYYAFKRAARRLRRRGGRPLMPSLQRRYQASVCRSPSSRETIVR